MYKSQSASHKLKGLDDQQISQILPVSASFKPELKSHQDSFNNYDDNLYKINHFRSFYMQKMTEFGFKSTSDPELKRTRQHKYFEDVSHKREYIQPIDLKTYKREVNLGLKNDLIQKPNGKIKGEDDLYEVEKSPRSKMSNSISKLFSPSLIICK